MTARTGNSGLPDVALEADRLNVTVIEMQNMGRIYIRLMWDADKSGDTYLEVGGRRALDLLRLLRIEGTT